MRALLSGDAEAAEALATLVGELETRTDAEIVVVIAARSDAYRDRSLAGASLLALALGAVHLLGPWWISPGWFLVDLVAVGVIADRVLRWPGPVRRLVPAALRAERVDRAARAAFVEEAVHGTPNRTGVLVYASALEDRVVLVPDLGIDGLVPRGELGRVQTALEASGCDGLEAGLRALGEVLARRVPHTAQSDATDLPNAPRIRP
ncbi:MAG: hypothetical protein H6732_04445 [Alphaproteobacteria bacterium]|nr:hypothetical protein [Alphaproteobacteria bacterium]